MLKEALDLGLQLIRLSELNYHKFFVDIYLVFNKDIKPWLNSYG